MFSIERFAGIGCVSFRDAEALGQVAAELNPLVSCHLINQIKSCQVVGNSLTFITREVEMSMSQGLEYLYYNGILYRVLV